MTRIEVFNRNRDVILAYLSSGNDGWGRNRSNSLYFEGPVLYSYGEHHPLAVRLKDGTYLVNEDKASTTTSTHTSLLIQELIDKRKVLSSFKEFRKYGIGLGPEFEHDLRDIDIIDFDGLQVLFELGGRQYLMGDDFTRLDGGTFLVRLPSGEKVSTTTEAYRVIIPDDVFRAVKAGLEVKRQGPWYFVPVDDLQEAKKGRKVLTERSYYKLHGSDHIATKAVVLEDGDVLVKGSVRHRPGSEMVEPPRNWSEIYSDEPIYRVVWLPEWHLAVEWLSGDND